ncbi:MIP/aquaporin family protein [Pseudoxanthomonas sp. Root630]|uniref:aquaporin n=1 Tax=Pseudoxanthomonas sp. Root630 TaxID=1736574 RepID=UPI00070376C6|nr:MIP/aquaporin family protein [Pseudoxanthomonas sp. Root630]KRA46690.1 MIP family channel protein [Pseudoxanthomonas sp. Root630]
MTWGRRLVAEALGTAFLLAIVVGSGIMAERLSGGNTALALLANALATGAGLFALIQLFGGVSGAHFNPAVSLAMALDKQLAPKEACGYMAAQFVGALLGVAAAHAMFDLAPFSPSQHVREGISQVWSEFVATFGLVLVIAGVARHGLTSTALAVAAYITAAYWFTASTSFANPAVTLARAFTDSFSGIQLSGVPWFVAAQVLAAIAAAMVAKWIWGPAATSSR